MVVHRVVVPLVLGVRDWSGVKCCQSRAGGGLAGGSGSMGPSEVEEGEALVAEASEELLVGKGAEREEEVTQPGGAGCDELPLTEVWKVVVGQWAHGTHKVGASKIAERL